MHPFAPRASLRRSLRRPAAIGFALTALAAAPSRAQVTFADNFSSAALTFEFMNPDSALASYDFGVGLRQNRLATFVNLDRVPVRLNGIGGGWPCSPRSATSRSRRRTRNSSPPTPSR